MIRMPVTRVMFPPGGMDLWCFQTCAMFSPSASDEREGLKQSEFDQSWRPVTPPNPVLARPARTPSRRCHPSRARSPSAEIVGNGSPIVMAGLEMSNPSANRKRPSAAITG